MLNALRAVHRRLGIKYRLDRWRGYVRRFGLRDAAAVRRLLWSGGGRVEEIAVPRLAHPVAVRTGTADASTLEKIFVWNGYELDYPDGVKTVIDAGANIGLSAVFFATRFPEATVVAIEPNAENFALLQRNAAPYPRVIPLRAALWGEDTTLGLSNPDDRVDSYRYSPDAAAETVEALSVPSLLQRFGLARADVMKIDVEGAEAAIFAGRPAWVGRVAMFIVELHGDEARAIFRQATASLDAVRYEHGEDEVVRVR